MSVNIERFAEFREALPRHQIISGDDGMLPFFATLRCDGLVSVASNVWPVETKLYVERCLTQNMDGLLPLWDKATRALFLASNPVPVKALLHHKGWIKTPELKLPLHHEDFHHLEEDFHLGEDFRFDYYY
jgi:4-hydroxy-tetrahydrodipicolinate synthase